MNPNRFVTSLILSSSLLISLRAMGQRVPDFIEISPGAVVTQIGPGERTFCYQTVAINNQTPYTLRKVRLAFMYGDMNYTADIQDVVAYKEKEKKLRIESIMCRAAVEGPPRIRILECDMPPMKNTDCARLLRLKK